MDQFARGTPWDWVRQQPATLHEDELEYQEGWKERRSRLDARFEIMPPLVWNGKRSTKTPIRV